MRRRARDDASPSPPMMTEIAATNEPNRPTLDPHPVGPEAQGLALASAVQVEIERRAHAATIDWPAREAAVSSLSPGQEFGKYELLEEIGRGGMGVVYKARQTDLDRLVAVKMILSAHLASPEQVRRFYAEARAAAKLSDPCIVAIHDVGEIRGQHFFAMEYVPGESLAQRLIRGPVPFAEAARMLQDVATAVDHLHEQGIVHRDLKPSNILLDPDDRPRVTDFGLAKMLQADGAMTHTGAIVGTPGYMAPEQAAARAGEVGPASDIWGLGAILYELLTGRPPFAQDSPLETLVQVVEGEPERPSRRNPAVPRALELICLKCLEKNPADRYRSASAMAAELGRYLRGEPVEARSMGIWPRLRRWARREPALVTRLSSLAICGSFFQTDQYLLSNFDARLNLPVISLLALGGAASLTFQALLKSARWAGLARYAWATADMALFTTIVVLYRGMSTPLVAGYFLLVGASGLWFRERLVGFTTILALASYASLGLVAARVGTGAGDFAHQHLLFLTLLTIMGLIIGYQVKRVRALSLYYEHRPLP